MLPSSIACPSRRQRQATRNCQWNEVSFLTCSPSVSSSAATWPCTASVMASKRSSPTSRARRSMKSLLWSDPCSSSAGIMWVSIVMLIRRLLPRLAGRLITTQYHKKSFYSDQIYTHLNNVFELLSKAVVESKQKVNIHKLSKEEPEEKEESEKAKREEERGTRYTVLIYIVFLLPMHNV